MDYSQEEIAQIKQGRGRFLAMATAYCLGVFNDNYFKQAGLLLAVIAGLDWLQAAATFLFSAPFVLFSAYAGWLADHYPKRTVVIWSKGLELLAMIIGAIGMVTLNWYLIVGMIFIMGLQSTIFGPALSGSIPELYPERYVTKANAILKLVVSLAVLVAISTAGISLDVSSEGDAMPWGRIIIAVSVLVVAVIGFLASFRSVKTESAGSRAPFPWMGPVISIENLKVFSHDKQLITAILCSLYFYFTSSLLVVLINSFGINELGLSQTMTSMLSVSLMVGVSIGAFISAKITLKITWTKVLAPSAMALGLCLTSLFLMPSFSGVLAYVFAYVILTLTGIAGGIFLIPVTSFIQTHPPREERGKAIAVSNFLDFSGIMVGAVVFWGASYIPLPSVRIGLLGIMSLGVAILLYKTRKIYV